MSPPCAAEPTAPSNGTDRAGWGGQNPNPKDSCLGMDGSPQQGTVTAGDGARGIRKSSAETVSRLLQVSELNYNSHLEYLTDI